MKSDDKISAWNLIARNWIQTDGIRRGRRGTRICGCSNKSRLECEFQRCGFLWELRVSNTCTTSKCSFPIILESLILLLELIFIILFSFSLYSGLPEILLDFYNFWFIHIEEEPKKHRHWSIFSLRYLLKCEFQDVERICVEQFISNDYNFQA